MHRKTATELLSALEQAGKRRTHQRYVVCEALEKMPGHPSALAIYEHVAEQIPMISPATVYNTIDTLRELGLIHRIEIEDDRSSHYDLDDRPHVNVVCRSCGSVIDFHNASVIALRDEIGGQLGVRFDEGESFVIYAGCAGCHDEDD